MVIKSLLYSYYSLSLYTEMSKLISKGTGEVLKCHLYWGKEFILFIQAYMTE